MSNEKGEISFVGPALRCHSACRDYGIILGMENLKQIMYGVTDFERIPDSARSVVFKVLPWGEGTRERVYIDRRD